MTQPAISGPTSRGSHAREQALVFSIGNFSFVIGAAAVQEIRNTDSLGGSVIDLDQCAIKKVAHIVERDSRFYYVVSGCEHFHLAVSRPTTVLILRDAPVAVLVDRIEEMAELRVVLPLPRAFCGEERVWYRGLTVLGRRILPVANPRGFLAEAELRQLEEQNPELLHIVGAGAREKKRA
jgi:chemotaxis signal transduction protein